MKKCSIDSCSLKYAQAGYCWRHYKQIYRYGKIFERTVYDSNEVMLRGTCAIICLYNQRGEKVAETTIDTEDAEKVMRHKWHLSNSGYATTKIGNKTVFLHSLICKKPQGFDVDHINRNKLDNRSSNLRIATRSQNLHNKKARSNNKSGFTGVSFRKERNHWRSRIAVNGKELLIGSFSNKEDAIKSRIDAEKRYLGEFANNHSDR